MVGHLKSDSFNWSEAMKGKGKVEGKGTDRDVQLGQGEIKQDKVRGVSHEFYTSHLNDNEYLFKSITYQPI